MRINNNLMAMNTARQLGVANDMTSKSMEKLSSGYRINRAGDDAAGLAISEKMRGQIRGLTQASRNAQDSISLVQTAEGALNETQSILQRMRELAVQSSNDTNVTGDRSSIQGEIDELAKEIGRIANNTEFNTQKLLDGSFTGTFHIGANEGQNISLDIASMQGFDLGITGSISATIDSAISPAVGADTTAQITGGAADGTYTAVKDGTTYNLVDSTGKTVATSADGKAFTGNGGVMGDDTFSLTSTVADGGKVVITSNVVDKFDTEVANNGIEAGSYTASTTQITDANGNVIATSTDATNYKDAEGNTLVTFGAALTASTALTIGGVKVNSQVSADAAITTVQGAIDKVSGQRAQLGAVQNRLEHSIKNLDTSAENLQAAESRVRDVDMAKEMMEFTKNNILTQAAQAMLAQANQAPQGVLQLLR